jgi:hypothetical protein
MARRTDYSKSTSYSPMQRVPLSPAKAWTNKLRVNSYYSDGRSASCFASEKTAPPPERTRHIVRFRDLDEQ